eukprot:GHVN01002358.1.p1 GENE.GHVN01002358.1~~GHVN01002358.1.p1  ORF type:complete len:1954 (+),score=221.04 GHVN01002358.1:543-6404(+)
MDAVRNSRISAHSYGRGSSQSSVSQARQSETATPRETTTENHERRKRSPPSEAKCRATPMPRRPSSQEDPIPQEGTSNVDKLSTSDAHPSTTSRRPLRSCREKVTAKSQGAKSESAGGRSTSSVKKPRIKVSRESDESELSEFSAETDSEGGGSPNKIKRSRSFSARVSEGTENVQTIYACRYVNGSVSSKSDASEDHPSINFNEVGDSNGIATPPQETKPEESSASPSEPCRNASKGKDFNSACAVKVENEPLFESAPHSESGDSSRIGTESSTSKSPSTCSEVVTNCSSSRLGTETTNEKSEGADVQSDDSYDDDLEFYCKMEGRSFRELRWVTEEYMTERGQDSKVSAFLRKRSDSYRVPIPVADHDECNFQLYQQVERVMSVRFASQSKAEKGQPRRREFLVKWYMLGYGESTWELEEKLNQPEDKARINKYLRANELVRARVFEPPAQPAESPKGKANKAEREARIARRQLRVNGTSSEGNEANEATCTDVTADEVTAVTDQEGSSQMWNLFEKRKLGEDSVYLPSKGDSGEHVKLMEHQLQGIKWMLFCIEKRNHGCMLADEMGLGKTCQAIAAVEHILECLAAGGQSSAHALVVVQKTTLENWRREFELWAPHLNVLPFYGDRSDRETILEHENKWVDMTTCKETTAPKDRLLKPDVVFVTFEGMHTQEFKRFAPSSFRWSVVVVDECQKAKNKNSKVVLTLRNVNRECCILLTGTPVQNTTEELYPLLSLIDPVKFTFDKSLQSGSRRAVGMTKAKGESQTASPWTEDKFSQTFGNMQERDGCVEIASELQLLLRPYVLRREKANVLKTLPPKTVKLIKIPLTLIQKRCYSGLWHRSITRKEKDVSFNNMHLQLRKVCVHPFLIEGMKNMIMEGLLGASQVDKELGGIGTEPKAATVSGKIDSNETPCGASTSLSAAGEPESEEAKYQRLLRQSSGKFVLLTKILPRFRSEGRKCLIFSGFKKSIDLVEDLVCDYGWKYERVDGETVTESRQLAIDRFNLDPERFLFLCTTRAGGLGINLTAATVVIHLDCDFNPQQDLQAQARCHRIGQFKSVDVYHLIAEHTYEDCILYNIAGRKLGLEAVLLGQFDDPKNGKVKLDKQQEEDVLRKGVYAALRDDDDAGREAADFASRSIDDILSNRTAAMTLGGESAARDGSRKDEEVEGGVGGAKEGVEEVEAGASKERWSGGTMFSTAHFASERSGSGDEEMLQGLNRNDPEFWVKVVARLCPLGEPEPSKVSTETLGRSQRRSRKPVDYRSALYGGEDGEVGVRRRAKRAGETDDHPSKKFRRSSSGEDDELYEAAEEETDDEEYETQDDDDEYVQFKGKRRKAQSDSSFSHAPLGPTLTHITPGGPQAGTASDVTLRASSAARRRVGVPVRQFAFPPRSEHKYLVYQWAFQAIQAIRGWLQSAHGESCSIKAVHVHACDASSSDVIAEESEAKFGEIREALALADRFWGEGEHMFSSALRKTLEVDVGQISGLDEITMKAKKDMPYATLDELGVHKKSLANACITPDRIAAHARKLLDFTLGGASYLEGATFEVDGRWIGHEDLCIKMVYRYFVSNIYLSNKVDPGWRLNPRWPPPKEEVKWELVQQVVAEVSKFLHKNSRTRQDVMTRFYDALDSRWKRSRYSGMEWQKLTEGLRMGRSAEDIAKTIPGRNLVVIKKGIDLYHWYQEGKEDDGARKQPLLHKDRERIPQNWQAFPHARTTAHGVVNLQPATLQHHRVIQQPLIARPLLSTAGVRSHYEPKDNRRVEAAQHGMRVAAINRSINIMRMQQGLAQISDAANLSNAERAQLADRTNLASTVMRLSGSLAPQLPATRLEAASSAGGSMADQGSQNQGQTQNNPNQAARPKWAGFLQPKPHHTVSQQSQPVSQLEVSQPPVTPKGDPSPLPSSEEAQLGQLLLQHRKHFKEMLDESKYQQDAVLSKLEPATINETMQKLQQL